MIKVTRLRGNELFINIDLIQTIEATPNTVITFNNDIKIVVEETPEVIVQRVMEYQARVGCLSTSLDFED